MAAMSIRLFDSDKIEADNLFKNLGLATNSAINMFIKQSIRQQGLPFIQVLDVHNQKLTSALEESDVIIQEIKSGKIKAYKDSDSLFRDLDK